MTWLEALFWLSAVCVSYAYVGYPLILAVAGRLWPAHAIGGPAAPDLAVSVVLAAHNEESRVGARVRELVELVAARPAGGELIVVSDGSTDRTVEQAQAAASEAESVTEGRIVVQVLVQETNLGKAAALNEAHAVAVHPFLVFADARQSWAPDAIDRLVAGFRDHSVGAVSGDLVVESAPGVMAGVGLYWRFEKWLRRTESRFDSMVSVTGCISAVRRELFTTLPVGTILDDVYWPLAVAMAGYRVIHEERARAFDRLPERARDEFRRKVRTLAGNFQLMARMPAVLLPWRNRLWWQFVSHRALRLVVPWALLAALFTAAALPGPLYLVGFWSQVIFYMVGLAGSQPAVAARSRLAAGIASFLVLNAAAWVAFWVWTSGRRVPVLGQKPVRPCTPPGRLVRVPLAIRKSLPAQQSRHRELHGDEHEPGRDNPMTWLETVSGTTRRGETHVFFGRLLAVCLIVTGLSACEQGPETVVPRARWFGWMRYHQGLVERARKGNVELLFLGDSITQFWNENDVWKRFYGSRNAANFGISGDRTQHVLWRIQNGELEGIDPKVVVLMIGTNNAGSGSADEIAQGVTAIVAELRHRRPRAKVLLLGIFPRGEKPDEIRAKLDIVNAKLAGLDDGSHVKFLDIGKAFMNADDTISRAIMPDYLHLSQQGYQIWAESMEPALRSMLAASAGGDQALRVVDIARVGNPRRDMGWHRRPADNKEMPADAGVKAP